MTVHRAISACPTCNEESEVWFYRGKVEPMSTIHCVHCAKPYDPSSFIICLLELYQNITVSTYTAINI